MKKRLILLYLKVSFAFCLFDCDFESDCEWSWEENRGIQVISGENSTHDTSLTDSEGNFLYYGVDGNEEARRLKITSPPLEEGTGNMCSIEMDVNMYNMKGRELVILAEANKANWIIAEIKGTSDGRWEHYKRKIGRITQRFRLVLETERFNTSQHLHIAIDNLTLVDCIRDRSHPRSCEPHHFRCSEGTCYERDRVCDLISDCSDGKDEQECDLLPKGSMCNFEDGFCGWSNVDGNHGSWVRSSGSNRNRNYRKGPNNDHTYKNTTGMYVFANFYKTSNTFGHQAVLRSEWFRPPPLYHRLRSSAYYESCKVRFHYHVYGDLAAHLWLECVVLNHNQQEGKPMYLWGTNRNEGDVWHRLVVPIPNITSSFALQFVATSNVRVASDIAIDDVSLSPECFGFGVPENESRGTSLPEESDLPSENVDHYRYVFGTCNAKGHLGPDIKKCSKAYLNTSTRVTMKANNIFLGVQIWSVPHTNVYTLFAGGASGGQGVNNRGSSKGAIVRATFNWTVGDLIYILIGQKGSSACSTAPALPAKLRKRCKGASREKRGTETLSRRRKKEGGAGGGGGATFVFKLRPDGFPEPVPLLVAAGGGGLSSYVSNISTLIYEAPSNGKILPENGYSSFTGAGGGGGWNGTSFSHTAGQSAWEGGRGGVPCSGASEWKTYGGFGGGGGGCDAGGGGGGFRGGDACKDDDPHWNGQNGISFVSPKALLPHIEKEANEGDGFLEIFAAQRGCGCQYLCVLTQMKDVAYHCICPDGTTVEDDGKCSGFVSQKGMKQTLYTSQLVVTILSCLAVAAVVAFVTILTLSRYRTKRLGKINRKPQENAELQLNRLRQSGGRMVTEYNPNYEFGGSTCSLQDLREIPRDTLTLIRALGQGAFGEVYQGYLSNLPGENGDIPVAVKTLPEFSSNEAEMDFLMEALIMSKFNHPNIVRFIGVCFEKLPRFIILELLLGGDLKSFLRESRPKPNENSRLNMADLLNLALDVAKGCHYLEDHHFIHRDIAARNCLLTMKGPGRVVKIADFGMARDIYRADYYRKGGKAMLPIKWMPPEAFLDGIFTCKTDVWSFGVLLWEVMSLGYMPYPGRGNQEVMQLVTSGGRLEPPTNCPNPVYRIMRQCWHPIPDERPCFNTVIERLGYCLQDPDVLRAPLPVFHRPPSVETDATVMRPLDCDGLCLQVQRPERDVLSPNSDYMVPMPSSNYSLSTERTELQTSSSESVDKLLEINDSKPIQKEDTWDAKFVQPTGQRRADGYRQLPYILCDKNNVKFSSLKSLDSLLLTTKASQSDKSAWDASSVVLDIMALGKPATEALPSQYINVDVNSNSRNRLDNADQSQLNHSLLDNYSCSNPAVSPRMADNRNLKC